MTSESFKSKCDWWIAAWLWAGVIVALAATVSIWRAPVPIAMRAGSTLLLVGASAFILWVLFGTRYILRDDELLVRCGPVEFRVPLAKIESVRPSRNPLSSPALSLDRLLIRWGRLWWQMVLISPADKTAFLQAVARRCPHLRLEGDRLERVED